MEPFHAMCTWTAYVAAELHAATSGRELHADSYLTNRLLGDAWWAVVSALQRLPAADASTSLDALDDLSVAVGRCIEAWLEHVGFAFEDRGAGVLHFGVLNPEDWVRWADVASYR